MIFFFLQGHFFLCSLSVGPAEGGTALHRSDSGRCRLTSLTQALKQISVLRVGNSRHTSENGCPRSRWRFGDSWLACKWPQFCIFLISLYGEGWGGWRAGGGGGRTSYFSSYKNVHASFTLAPSALADADSPLKASRFPL